MFKCYYLLQCLRRTANPLLQMALQLWWMSIRVTHFKCAWFISAGVSISSRSMLYWNTQSHCQGQPLYEFFKQNALITYQVLHRKEKQKGIAFAKRFLLKGQREDSSVPCCYWWRGIFLYSLGRKHKNLFLSKNLLRRSASDDKTSESPSSTNGEAAPCSLLKWAWNQILQSVSWLCFLASAVALCHLNVLTHSTGPSTKPVLGQLSPTSPLVTSKGSLI